MIESAKDLCVHAIELALEDRISDEMMRDFLSKKILVEKENRKYAEIMHAVSHFVADEDIRTKDLEYDLILRNELNDIREKILNTR